MQLSTTPLFRILAAALLTTALVACGDDDDPGDNGDPQNQNQNQNQDPSNDLDPEDVIDPAEHDIEIAGNWETQFDTREDIDDEYWTFVYEENDDLMTEVVDFDNEEQWVITKNPDDAEFSPGMYNRNVWTGVEDDRFHYCTVDFGLESEDEARNSEETADDEDLDGGCGDDNPWSEMTRL